jgi:2-polyprenyl-6-methoxyphenol hydroxylase-like FAD-dependent oxidoreductase
MAADATVLVVGGGPTGLLLAAQLYRRGVECRLIDANPAPLHWDRATIVHPRSLEVFESLGIVEPLLAVGVKQHMARIHSAGKVLGEIDLSICGSRYGFNVGISEEVTESILTNYLEEQGGKVARASKLVGLEKKKDGLIATIEREGVQEQISVEWVVGCDGVHSATRMLSGIEVTGPDVSEPWAVFDVTLPGWPHSYEAIYGYLDEPPVIITSLPQRRWRVYLRPSSEESDLITDALTTLRRYLPAIEFENVTNPTRFHCHAKVAKRYRSGRILVAGDAAHVCSPSQGHGMNSGLQDAFNLAWKLALVCQGRCSDVLLDSYEAERHPVADAIITSGLAFEHDKNLTEPAERRARDETMREVFMDPKSRHHESVAEAELDIDYSESPIVMGDKHEALGPGERLPDTIEVFLANGKTGRLHELTNRAGHTALVIVGVSADGDGLTQLDAAIRALGDTAKGAAPLVEASVVVTAGADGEKSSARLAPEAAERLGVDGITLLVIRPDGHVGLRADRNHLAALAAYEKLLVSGCA